MKRNQQKLNYAQEQVIVDSALRNQMDMTLKNLAQAVPGQSWVSGWETSGCPLHSKLLHDSYAGFLTKLYF